MADEFKRHAERLDSPADNAFSASLSDTVNLPKIPRGLYIGTGGDLRVLTKEGEDVTFRNVLGGTILPVRTARLFASGSSASDIIGLY